MHRKRLVKILAIGVAVILLIVGAGAAALRVALGRSLPGLDGTVRIEGLRAPVTIERDARGVPSIRGSSRADVARATGFVHAQDRFFQMDLMRRRAAGELAELFGPGVLSIDRANRIHRFRAVAQRVLETAPPDERAWVEAYAEGVNAGLASLRARPFEYVLLRSRPASWKAEDTVLIVLAMFIDLQDGATQREATLAAAHDTLPPPLFDFLAQRGSEWDAPLEGGPVEPAPIPGPDVVDLRRPSASPNGPRSEHRADPLDGPLPEHRTSMSGISGTFEIGPITSTRPEIAALAEERDPSGLASGSNGWAVAGAHTDNGSALLASDMHLGLRVPNIWYRLVLSYPDDRGSGHSGTMTRIVGVSLPGAPAIVVGSNGRVAWGFTNTEGDYADLVVVEPVDETAAGPGAAPGSSAAGEAERSTGNDPSHGNTPAPPVGSSPASPPSSPEDIADRHDAPFVSYRTPGGPKPIETIRETLHAAGAPDETFEVKQTIWGPIVGKDRNGRPLALRWAAHDDSATNFGLMRMESADGLDDAIAIAHRCGIPAQNIQIADRSGRIGWTIAGRIPRRSGFDGRLPVSWADGLRRWDGWLSPDEVPRVVDPPGGRIWTANARVLGGAAYAAIGDGGFAIGSRARQIRDDLLAIPRAAPRDMLAVQLDDRALFLQRWRDLLLEVLTPEAVAGHPRRAELRNLVDRWGGRASIESAGYRLVRAFRLEAARIALGSLTAPCKQADSDFQVLRLPQWEAPLWTLVSRRPIHLLAPGYTSWEDALRTAAEAALDAMLKDGAPLATHTWGARNTSSIQHPLSLGLPALGRWLDMPPVKLAGDDHMPRVQAPSFGASERLIVSPGHEDEGLFLMPAGQSGHFLSSHYADGHGDWVSGAPAPLLPGPPVHTLTLVPSG